MPAVTEAQRLAIARRVVHQHGAEPRSRADARLSGYTGCTLLLFTQREGASATFEQHLTRASARARLAVLHRIPERFVALYDLGAGGAELDPRFRVEPAGTTPRARR